MLFLGLTIVFAFLAYKLQSFIRKHATKLYILFACISGCSVLLQYYLFVNKIRLQGLPRTIDGLFSRGIIGAALISVVMFVGAFNSRWDFTKKLRGIRAELSILACILILPHNIVYLVNSFMQFSKVWNADPSTFRTVNLTISATGIITVILLIPLFITSFKSIRKKMKAKSWKNLQRFAYPFYILIYVQIMLVHLGYANRRHYTEAIGYSLVFLPYIVMRLRKYYLDSSKKKLSKA